MFQRLSLFLFLITIGGCTKHIQHPTSIRDSFVMVKKSIKLDVCGKIDGVEQCKKLMDMNSIGSGAIVLNKKALVKNPRTLVLTAQHVCDDGEYKFSDFDPRMMIHIRETLKFKNKVTLKATGSMEVVNSYGETFPVKNPPWIQNMSADTCVIETSMNGKALTLGSKPEYGQKTLNVAAPKGVFQGNISGGGVYYTEGFYTGQVELVKGRAFSMYTIIAAPGSSGSPVLNMNGELIGMIHSIDARFCPVFNPGCMSAVSYGATREQVSDAISAAIAAIKRGEGITFGKK